VQNQAVIPFLDNIGKILMREQIIEAATDPVTARQPENWHQRLSELRTDDGYTILSWRNRGDLNRASKMADYIGRANEIKHLSTHITAGRCS
jgi:hypothetical protein